MEKEHQCKKCGSKNIIKRKDLINPNFRYFFEHMTNKHTIAYGKDVPPVIGLDIMPIEGAFGKPVLFLGRRAKEEAFSKLEIPCADLKGIFSAEQINDELITKFCEKSAYYDGKPEGVVLKNYGRTNVWGRQMFAKVVLQEFKETNKAVFGAVKKDTTDTLKLFEEFCTDARIKKRILVLTLENGMPLNRKLMNVLPIEVCKDIFKEETASILKNYKEIYFGTLKQLVAKKCLKIIDEMMCEKARDLNE